MGKAADELSAAAMPRGATATQERDDEPTTDELRARIQRQRSELGRDLEVLGEKVSPGRMIERRKSAMRDSMRSMRERVMGASDEATHRMREATESMEERVAHAPEAARQATEGNPLAAGLMAFGLGAVIAAAIPPSKQERRLAEQARPVMERARDEATSAAKHAAEELKPKAQEAAEHVRSEAETAAQEVRGEAQDSAEHVRSTAEQQQRR